MLKKPLSLLILLLVLAGAGLSYYLSVDDQMKLELSAQLSDASGYQVDIQGDLNWQILPSLGLTATNVTMVDEETEIQVGTLQAAVSLSELTKSPENWTLGTLVLNDIRIKDAGFRVKHFKVQDFALGQSAAFQAQLVMLQEAEPSEVSEDAAPIDVEGEMIYLLPTSKRNPNRTLSDLTITDTVIKARLGETPVTATCYGGLQEVDKVATTQTDTLSVYDAKMDCTSSEFSIDGISWPKSKASLQLKNRILTANMLAEKGSVDIEKLKATITAISTLTGKENPAADWPDRMQYQTLEVNASLKDEQVALTADLENIKVVIGGTLDQDDSTIDLKGTLAISEASEDQLIDVDPLITDLPLPFSCLGTTAEPDCNLDSEAAMPLVGDLLKREGKRKGMEKLQDSLLDGLGENLPDGLKEGAKELLNLFN